MDKSHYGAIIDNNGDCSFRIFAPHIQKAEISINNQQGQISSLTPTGLGFHEITLKKVSAGTAYSYTLDGISGIPDPASRWQPKGLKNGSIIFDHHFFDWKGDSFSGLPISEMIIYEAHVGTFSADESFSGIISRLDHLKTLGINTLQLMPVSQFAGSRGWGYETVYPYAVHSSYGSPDELKALIKRCHLNGIAVIIDVSFSSLTPVDELTPVYPPFFSQKFNSTLGKAINFDEKYSYGIREYYIQCALSWFRDYRVDGLRVSDAHNIFDQTPIHFLEELATRVKKFAHANHRECILITGDKRNALRPVLPQDKGGYEIDALYNNEFHNALRHHLTGETEGHMNDFTAPKRLIAAMQFGFAYRGELSNHYLRLQGRKHSELNGCKFVVYSQSHELDSTEHDKCRTIQKAGFEAAKLSAGATLLSPYIPMIFMGEEYGEPAPFHYFTDSRSLPRNLEQEDTPLPEDKSTFSDCRLDWLNMETEQGKAMLSLYRKLIKIRSQHPTIHEPCRSRCQVLEIIPGLVLIIRNPSSGKKQYAAVLLNFNDQPSSCMLAENLPEGVWTTALYSAAAAFGGSAVEIPRILPRTAPISMAAKSFALFFYTGVNL